MEVASLFLLLSLYNTSMRSEKVKSIVVIVVITIIWGGTFPLVKTMLGALSPMQIVSYRFFFASLFALPFFILKVRRHKEAILKLFLLGVILFLAYFFQTLGMRFTTSSKSGFITGLYIVFTPIFAMFFIKEKPSVKLVVALILSVIGLMLLSGVTFHSFNFNIGDFITVFSAIAYAIQIVLTAIYVRDTDVSFVAAVQMISMFLCSMPFNYANFFRPLSVWIMLSLLFLGGIAGYIAILAEAYSLKFIDPDTASIIFTLEPVFAGITSYIFLKERPTFVGMIGAVLILIAMYFAIFSHPSRSIGE